MITRFKNQKKYCFPLLVFLPLLVDCSGSSQRLKVKAIANWAGDFEMDDEIFHMKIFLRNISKKCTKYGAEK